MFEDISKIRRAVTEIPAYERFPYTYYVSRAGSILSVPSENSMKVDVFLVELNNTGVAVYSVNGGVYIRGYRVDGGRVVEDDEAIVEIIDRLVSALNGNDIGFDTLKINRHTITGISLLLDLDYETVRRMVSESMLKQILEDRTVAIFGDDVIVLSKRKFMRRYSGADAVSVAKRYAFVMESPVSGIAEFVSEQLGKQITFFIFESGTIVCGLSECREAPLPPNISRLVAEKLKTSVAIDLTAKRPEDYRNTKLFLPSSTTGVAIGKGVLYYLGPDNSITARMYTNIWHRYPFLLIFSSHGFIGFGIQNGNRIKAGTNGEKRGEEEREDYLEETVHIS